MVYISKFQTSNETLPVNILTINSDSNAETNSTISDDPIDSRQNNQVGNSSLRLANNEDDKSNKINQNLSLYDINGKHPEFPEPSF